MATVRQLDLKVPVISASKIRARIEARARSSNGALQVASLAPVLTEPQLREAA